MKGLNEIGNFFKSVQGILTCVIVAGGIVSSALLRHDAKVRSKFVETHQSVNIIQVDSVVKLRIAPITSQIEMVITNQKTLQTNYSNFVEANTNSFDEWKKYMNGLEFTVVQSTVKSVNKSIEAAPEMKIRVQKIKK
jgi:hypothetical protein